MFYSSIGLFFLYFMFFFRHNIISSFSIMGRNRKTLGGGKWGEAVMETIMNAHSQIQRHNGGGKYSKSRNWDKNAASLSRPSSTSPSPYSTRNKGGKYYKNKGNSGNGNNDGGKGEPLYQPRTANQALYLKYLMDNRIKIVLGVGPAGCGKTLFACHRAVEELMEGGIERIVITRPMVSVEDESVGFLPGDMTQKMAPWTRPIFDIFHEYFDPLDVQDMIRRGVIEISPLAYMRGRTFKDAFIIADEMQNSTPNQMLMLTTRLGENSKMAITGDLKQSDKGLENNGLADFMRKLYGYRRAKMAQESASVSGAGSEQGREGGGAMGGFLGVKLVQLCSTDICRSDIVSRILDMYQVASDAPVSVLDYSSGNMDKQWEDLEEGEGFGGEEGEGDIRQIPYYVSKPYYSSDKKQGKYGKPDFKSPSLYQPKPKRHQVSIIDEPEYQEDFEKNLKKVIENNLLSENKVSNEDLESMENNTVETPAEEAVETMVIDTSLMEKTDIAELPEIRVEEPKPEPVRAVRHGSSDCALIPKRDEERSKYFRFFS